MLGRKQPDRMTLAAVLVWTGPMCLGDEGATEA